MATMTRPLEGGDLHALDALDRAYAARVGVSPLVDRAVLAFYGRSGHAFVRDAEGTVTGFALAHAVWDGGRPVVRLARLVADGDGEETYRSLLEAVVKSAYDAAVYDLVAEAPAADGAARAALGAASFEERPTVRLERTLGSRGAARA